MFADHCTLSTFIYHLHAMGYQFDLDSSGQTAFQVSNVECDASSKNCLFSELDRSALDTHHKQAG